MTRLRTYALRAALAAEGVTAFALWGAGVLEWQLAGLFGVPVLIALWCTWPEPHRAGEPSERLRVTPLLPLNPRADCLCAAPLRRGCWLLADERCAGCGGVL